MTTLAIVSALLDEQKGLLDQLQQHDHQVWIQGTIQLLQQHSQQQDFLAVWRETSQQTAFTANDFPSSIN